MTDIKDIDEGCNITVNGSLRLLLDKGKMVLKIYVDLKVLIKMLMELGNLKNDLYVRIVELLQLTSPY